LAFQLLSKPVAAIGREVQAVRSERCFLPWGVSVGRYQPNGSDKETRERLLDQIDGVMFEFVTKFNKAYAPYIYQRNNFEKIIY
jgi:hypothetical protein